MCRRLAHILMLVATVLLLAAGEAQARAWTHRETGEVYYGELVEVLGAERVVIIEGYDGKRRTMPVDLLIPADVDFLTDVALGEVPYEEYGRLWTARRGGKTIRAEFVERTAEGKVKLITEGGRDITVAWEALTAADQSYVIQATNGSGMDLSPKPPTPQDPDTIPLPPRPVTSDTATADLPWYELPRDKRREGRATVIAAHSGLMNGLYVLAALAAVGGWIWLVRSGFRVSRDWGLLLLLGGPPTAGLTNVLFAIGRWKQAQNAFLVWLAGMLLWLVTLLFVPYWLA